MLARMIAAFALLFAGSGLVRHVVIGAVLFYLGCFPLASELRLLVVVGLCGACVHACTERASKLRVEDIHDKCHVVLHELHTSF